MNLADLTQALQSSVEMPPLGAQIVETIAAHFGTDADAILARGKRQNVARARHLAALALSDTFGAGSHTVAEWLRRVDHTSILNSRRRARALLDQGDPTATRAMEAAHEIVKKVGVVRRGPGLAAAHGSGGGGDRADHGQDIRATGT